MAEDLLEHASRCENCAAMLRSSIEVFAAEETVPHPAPPVAIDRARIRGGRPRIWLAAAAAVVLGAGLAILYQRSGRVDKLLAEAYSENRPFEFRLPDNGYSPLKQQRGGGSPFSKPHSLLEAEAEISGAAKHDARYWKRKGTTELLDGDAEAAVSSFNSARDQAPDDPDTLVGLAIAMAFRGDVQNRGSDYGAALDLLSNVVNRDPGNRRASFNRALVCERLQMVPEAIRQWNAYLKLDNSSRWAEEARRRLRELNSRQWRRQLLLSKVAAGAETFLASAPPEHADEFMDRAAVAWLADAPGHATPAASAVRLAGLMSDGYGDRWLADAAPEAKQFGAAPLLAIVDANIHGHYDEAAGEAAKYLLALPDSVAPALAARVRTEQVYALARAVHPRECVAAARRLAPQLDRRSYRWLALQNRLELDVCIAQLGQEGEAIRDLEDSLASARRQGFSNLALRASGLLVNIRTQAGGAWAGWNDDVAGLEAYWRSGAPPNRGQQFFFNLALASETLGLRFAAFDLGAAAVEQFAAVDNRMTEALGYSKVATLAMNAGLPGQAAVYFDRAATESRNAGDSPTAVLYRGEAELARIQMDFDTGRLDEARRLLPLIQTSGASTPGVMAIQFRRELLLGRLAMRSDDRTQARRHLGEAVALANQRLASLKSAIEKQRAIDEDGRAVKAAMLERFAEGGQNSGILDSWLGFRYASPPVGDGEIRLVFVALDGRVAAWISTSEGARFRWLDASPGQIAALRADLMNLESDPRSDAAAIGHASQALSTALLGPWRALLTGSRLLVVMEDDDLAPVPFALLTGDDGRPLGETHAVMHCIRRAGSEQQHITPASKALMIAEPESAAGAGPASASLSDAIAEARAAAGQFTDHRLLESGQANPAGVRAIASGIEIFHFAGHGFSQGGEGALGLRDSLFGASEISAIDWRACRLAVLSACLTAPGEPRGVVNPDSLVRAFLNSGAHNVVAAAWSVDSRATRMLMDTLYPRLVAGATPAEALQAAQKAMRADPEFRHPYYWGAFQLYE